MKVAIVHDELLRKGGAERVVISIHKLYPEADIFTIAYRPDSTFQYFKKCNVKTSFLNSIVSDERWLMLLFFPLGIMAVRRFDLSGYDLVILSSAHGAQYIKRSPTTRVINYAHYVFRLIWRPESYNFFKNRLTAWLLNPIIRLLKAMDLKMNVRADLTIFNSMNSQKTYLNIHKETVNHVVLNPPIDFSLSELTMEPGKYFLVVSRLEPYKKVDLVVDVFKNLSNEVLIIVGSGTLEAALKKQASGNKNIQFLKNISQERLTELYTNSKALIFPQEEDFGITPLESNACGVPVIAYKKGGVLETMVENKTAIFFNEQSKTALIEAIGSFYECSFDKAEIAKNALRFAEDKFHEKLKGLVQDTMTIRKTEEQVQ